MDVQFRRLALFLCAITLASQVRAQSGDESAPEFQGAVTKLFHANSAFSADMESQVDVSADRIMKLPQKVAFDSGKFRVDMNFSDITGNAIVPALTNQAKAMGMDKSVTLFRPDTKISYSIYPDISAYAPTPFDDPDDGKPASAFRIKTRELGKETVDGHPCIKKKAVVRDDQDKTREFTIWNATDLKQFPIKVEMVKGGKTMRMLFRNVKLSKPDTTLFDLPANYKKFDSLNLLVQEAMMKQLGKLPSGH